MANTGSGRKLLLLCSQGGFYFCFLTIYKNAHVEMICTFLWQWENGRRSAKESIRKVQCGTREDHFETR